MVKPLISNILNINIWKPLILLVSIFSLVYKYMLMNFYYFSFLNYNNLKTIMSEK